VSRRRDRRTNHRGLAAVALPVVAVVVAALPAASAAAAPGSASGASALTPELPSDVVRASFAPGSTWQPEHAVYGTTSTDDVPVTMPDGTVLKVNVVYPTDPATGQPATGPFPVILTQTPYGKGQGGSSAPGSAEQPGGGSPTGGANDYLVQRGFIDVIADVRGTGDSGGSWGLFDPAQTSDGIALVDWAATLPHSSGKVGTYGPSYLGINQMLLAGSIGKGSPLKAIFPVVSATDTYRDTSFMGGLLDTEFDEAYLGLTAEGNTANPVIDAGSNPPSDASGAGDLASVEAQHAGGTVSYHGGFTAETLAGGPTAYDGDYWKARQPGALLDDIVANGIPAYLVGGEFDIFQRGEPLNYAGLQNAWAGRPSTAPMTAKQKTTGRYQLIDGPWEHLNGSSVDVDVLELAWFDQWLKGERTGIDKTPTPLHYYDLGSTNWTQTAAYPFAGATPTRLYLGSGTLSRTAPTAAGSGADPLVWAGTGVPCSRPVDQWAMGALSIPSQAAGLSAPCAEDDRPSQTPGTTSSYTTAPMTSPTRLAGPISATLYATATTTDSEWVVEVEDVAPDGTSRPLTEGALLGSLRAVDQGRSWTAPGGTYLLPYHPYTQESVTPVVPGQVTRYDVEVFPTYSTLAPGHSLRVTVSTADVPHLTPSAAVLPNLLGGVYSLQRTAAAPSSIEVPLQPVR
jgi:putative CocE/NonD family hydrolase